MTALALDNCAYELQIISDLLQTAIWECKDAGRKESLCRCAFNRAIKLKMNLDKWEKGESG